MNINNQELDNGNNNWIGCCSINRIRTL